MCYGRRFRGAAGGKVACYCRPACRKRSFKINHSFERWQRGRFSWSRTDDVRWRGRTSQITYWCSTVNLSGQYSCVRYYGIKCSCSSISSSSNGAGCEARDIRASSAYWQADITAVDAPPPATRDSQSINSSLSRNIFHVVVPRVRRTPDTSAFLTRTKTNAHNTAHEEEEEEDFA